jgi:hypothetical protein
MNGNSFQAEQFAVAARNFCEWATSPVVAGGRSAELAAQYLSALFAAGCALGWEEGEPCDAGVPDHLVEDVGANPRMAYGT